MEFFFPGASNENEGERDGSFFLFLSPSQRLAALLRATTRARVVVREVTRRSRERAGMRVCFFRGEAGGREKRESEIAKSERSLQQQHTQKKLLTFRSPRKKKKKRTRRVSLCTLLNNNQDDADRSRPPRLPQCAGGAGPRGARGRGTRSGDWLLHQNLAIERPSLFFLLRRRNYRLASLFS